MAAHGDDEEDDEFCYAIDDDQGPLLSSLNDFSFLVEEELSFVHPADFSHDRKADFSSIHGVDFSHDRKAVVREVKEEIVSDPTPKLAASLRTWLPLPHVDTQPHVWEFKHTARWPEDEFATLYWDSVGFTFPCESKQFAAFGLGKSVLVDAVCLHPHREHTFVIPSDAVVELVSREFKECSKRELAFNLFKEKHVMARRVEFVVVFSGEMHKYIPHIYGKIQVGVDPSTMEVTHTTTVSAIISFGYTEGSSLLVYAAKAYNALMARKVNRGLAYIFDLLFTRTNNLYTNADLEVSEDVLARYD